MYTLLIVYKFLFDKRNKKNKVVKEKEKEKVPLKKKK